MISSGHKMLFVTGASRSGTTLTAQLLGRHSQIAKLREMQFFGEFWDPRKGETMLSTARRQRAVEMLFDRQHRGIVVADGRTDHSRAHRFLKTLPADICAADLFAATVYYFATSEGKSIACEQTPRNIFYAAALLERFPNARVIHLLRDPRGVMASQKYRWRVHSLASSPVASARQQLRTRVNYHPYTVTQLWTSATRAALQLSEHPRFMLVKFEDLLEKPENVLRNISDFAEVDFEPRMLEVAHTNSSHVRPRIGEASGATFDRATIDRWRTTLTMDERAIARARCGALMRAAGYPDDDARFTLRGRLTYPPLYLLHLAGAVVVNPQRMWIQARAVFD